MSTCTIYIGEKIWPKKEKKNELESLSNQLVCNANQLDLVILEIN